jgi:hypothetical protein
MSVSHPVPRKPCGFSGFSRRAKLFGEEPGKNGIFLILRTFAPAMSVESADKYFERKREETKSMVYSKPRKPWVFLDKKKHQIGSSAQSESNCQGKLPRLTFNACIDIYVISSFRTYYRPTPSTLKALNCILEHIQRSAA